MRLLLDTNVVVGLLAENPKLVETVHRHAPQDFGVSVVGVHEMFLGAYKSQRQARNLAALADLRFAVVEFDHEDTRQAGEIRAALAVAGTPIGPYDVLIAAARPGRAGRRRRGSSRPSRRAAPGSV